MGFSSPSTLLTPHPNLAIFVTGLWVALCGTGVAASQVYLSSLGEGGRSHTPTLCRNSHQRGVSHSYTLQALQPEGRTHTSTLYRHSPHRGVSNSYTLQALQPEGSITLLHSTETPARGEVSHSYTLQKLPP